MKIKEYLQEKGPHTSGHDRLVLSIINRVNGPKPSKAAVEALLADIDKDVAFKKRIQKKAEQLGNQGYIWGSIRRRCVAHFEKKR